MIFKDMEGNTDAASITNVPTRERKNSNIHGGGAGRGVWVRVNLPIFFLFARDFGNYLAN